MQRFVKQRLAAETICSQVFLPSPQPDPRPKCVKSPNLTWSLVSIELFWTTLNVSRHSEALHLATGVRLLSGSTDKYIYMFDTQTGTKLQAWKGHVVHDLVVSHDGRYLISTTSERKVCSGPMLIISWKRRVLMPLLLTWQPENCCRTSEPCSLGFICLSSPIRGHHRLPPPPPFPSSRERATPMWPCRINLCHRRAENHKLCRCTELNVNPYKSGRVSKPS